jgi:hypothetical protein
MERPSPGESCTVSRYWTPQHLDVTNAPTMYAPPRAAWIDEFQRLRGAVASNTADRVARRRMHSHAIVDPCEITALPAFDAVRSQKADRPRAFLARVRSILRPA